MNLDVLYEDNHLIVVYKPAGILSQKDNTNDPDMLSIIKQYIKVKYQKPGEVFLGLVHRLDRMTEGIMVFARTSKAASRLSTQISHHNFSKKYYCLCHGLVIPPKGRLKHYVSKDEQQKKAYLDTNGKEAVLDYQVLSSINNKSFVDVTLVTGRFHQIRIQFASINHPIVGDCLYGNDQKIKIALCAYSLSFDHPTTKTRLFFTIEPKHPMLMESLKMVP